HEEDIAVRTRLKARVGAPYVRALAADLTKSPERDRHVRETIQDLTAILTEWETRERRCGGCPPPIGALRRETRRHDALWRVGVRPRTAVARLARVAGDR